MQHKVTFITINIPAVLTFLAALLICCCYMNFVDILDTKLYYTASNYFNSLC